MSLHRKFQIGGGGVAEQKERKKK